MAFVYFDGSNPSNHNVSLRGHNSKVCQSHSSDLYGSLPFNPDPSPSVERQASLPHANQASSKMRLLDTTTLQVVEFHGPEFPDYAILSHTWVPDEEISFQDVQVLNHSKRSVREAQAVAAIKAKSGYAKLASSASYVSSHGFQYIWIDTCCIDKTSSAELSEAINSMYRWYQQASLCFVYLQDVMKEYEGESADDFYNTCRESRWFTRGWTLQELIAPEDVVFCDSKWKYLGSKEHDRHIQRALSLITGVDVRVLDGSLKPSEIGVAERMKWAARRQTTRLEDKAYCLMGIFDVNMPLLYGEGERAFIRLQEQILSASDDQSIFLWIHSAAKVVDRPAQFHGLLADSPEVFANVIEHYRPLPPAMTRGTMTWQVTNQGLRVTLLLRPIASGKHQEQHEEYYAVLECTARDGDETYWSPTIRLRRLYGDQFARVDSYFVATVPTPSFDGEAKSSELDSWETIFVKRLPQYAIADCLVSFENVRSLEESDEDSCLIEDVWPSKHWDAKAARLKINPTTDSQLAGLFRFRGAEAAGDSPACTVDLAIYLTAESARAWKVRTMFREGQDTMRQAAQSANKHFLSGTKERRHHAHQGLAPPLRTDDGTWSDSCDNLRMMVQVEERQLHGRLYYYIHASRASADTEGNQPKLEPLPQQSTEVSTLAVRPMYPENVTKPDEPHRSFSAFFGDGNRHTSIEHRDNDDSDGQSKNDSQFPTLVGELERRFPDLHGAMLHETNMPFLDTWAPKRYMISSPTIRLTKGISDGKKYGFHSATLQAIQDLQKVDISGNTAEETAFLRCCRISSAQGGVAAYLSGEDSNVAQSLANCRTVDFDDFRLLHWAVIGGEKQNVHDLLALGANAHCKTEQGWTAAHLAAMTGRFAILNLIIERSVIGEARGEDSTSGLVTSSDVMARSEVNSQWDEVLRQPAGPLAESVLHLAMASLWSVSDYSNLGALRSLLPRVSEGVWESKNMLGETPKHRLAAMAYWGKLGSSLMVTATTILTSCAPQVNSAVDNWGRGLVWHAGCSSSVEMLDRVLSSQDHGGRYRAVNGHDAFEQIGPLHAVCGTGHVPMVAALLARGAHPDNTAGRFGFTAAHVAAAAGNLEVLRVLQQAGADLNVKTIFNLEKEGTATDQRNGGLVVRTPWDVALAEGHEACVELLEEYLQDTEATVVQTTSAHD